MSTLRVCLSDEIHFKKWMARAYCINPPADGEAGNRAPYAETDHDNVRSSDVDSESIKFDAQPKLVVNSDKE
jgi:hypothetical protein